MADPRTSFPVLEDSSTQAGLPIHKVLQGDALASKNAVPVLGFKDAANNLRYPKVDSQDRILVASNVGDEACLSANGELAAGSSTLADVTNAVITLVADLEYKDVGFVVSSFRDSLFQLVWDNNGSETVLAEILVGPGSLTASQELHCLSFTAGSTGTQELKVVAKNMNALSSLRATVTVTEVQP